METKTASNLMALGVGAFFVYLALDSYSDAAALNSQTSALPAGPLREQNVVEVSSLHRGTLLYGALGALFLGGLLLSMRD